MEIYETINKNMDSFFANASQEDIIKLLDKHNIKYSILDKTTSSVEQRVLNKEFKNFALFGWEIYKSQGGIWDLMGFFSTVDEAKKHFEEYYKGYTCEGHIIEIYPALEAEHTVESSDGKTFVWNCFRDSL